MPATAAWRAARDARREARTRVRCGCAAVAHRSQSVSSTTDSSCSSSLDVPSLRITYVARAAFSVLRELARRAFVDGRVPSRRPRARARIPSSATTAIVAS